MSEMQRRYGRLPNRDRFPCIEFPDGKCPRRQPGCQDKCPEFIKAKAENDTRKITERKKRGGAMDIAGYKASTYAKLTRLKQREK